MATTSITSAVSGGSVTAGNTDIVVAGGSITALTVSSGGALVISGGIDSGATVLASGTETVSTGSATGDFINGTLTVTGTSAVVSNETVLNGGVLDLFKGTITGTTVSSGGKLLISGGNTASNTTLVGGGTVELNTSGAIVGGSLTFSGGNNTLLFDKVLSAAAGDQAVITGFSSTDEIVVSGAGASPTLTISSGSSGEEVATLTSGSVSDSFTFSGAQYTSSTLSWVSASSGVYDLQYTPASSGSSTTSVTTSTASGAFTETAGNTLLVLSGGSVTAPTIANGAFLTISGGADASATISSGGTETVSTGSASGDLIFGTVSTLSGGAGVFTSETVENGGTFNLLNGNTAAGTTVLSGGLFLLSGNNGAVTSTVLSGGGTLELDSAKANISGSLTFEGGNNTLDIAVVVTTSSGFGDQAVISGFSSTDKIDVTALGTGATLAFTSSGGNEDVTVSGTGGSETFIFSGTTTYTSATLGLVSSGGHNYVEYTPVSSGSTTTSVTTSTASGAFTETAGNTLLVLSGGSVTAPTIANAAFLVLSGGADASATISAGGTETVSVGSARGDLIFGTVSTLSGGAGVFTSETVEDGGTFNLLNGNTAAGTTVLSGGLFLLSGNNGAVTSTVLSGGGMVELDSPKANISGSLTFAGGGNTLDIAVVASSGFGDLAAISGFSSTDKIDVTVLGTGATLAFTSSGGNEDVTVSGTGGSETFIFSGTTTYTSATLGLVSSGGHNYVEYSTSGFTSSGGTITSVTTSTASGAYTETAGNTLLVLSGGSVTAPTIANGAFLTVSGGADTSATISSGGTETVLVGSARGDLIFGTVATMSAGAGVFTSETVENGGTFNLLNGNSAAGTTVLSGGLFLLSGNNAAVTSTVLSGGGTLELDSPKANISGSLTFAGGGNTLDIAVIADATFGDQAVISGFSSTDKIDVTALGSGATLAFTSSGGNEDVTVSGTGGSETFIFSGTTTYSPTTLAVVTSVGHEYIEYSASGWPGITTSVTTSTASGAYTETPGNTLLVLSGGSVTAPTIDNGAFLVLSGGADTSATILSGGTETVSVGSASGDLIFGTVSTLSGGAGVFTSETVENGGTFKLLNGNTAAGITVLKGGLFLLSGNNGAVTDTVLSGGGTLELDSPKANISGSLTFEGGGNTLDIAVVASSGFGDLATISGFSSSDEIDVTGISATGATLTFASSNGNSVATISGTGGSESFIFSDPSTYNSSTMSLLTDGSGGVELILDTTPVVAFTSLNGLATNQATDIVNGTVNIALDPEAIGSTVSVLEGNAVVGTGTVGANGYWSAKVTFTNDNGANVLTARDTDAAGQTSVTSQSLTYNVNTFAPAFTPGNLVVSISGDGDGSGSYGDNQASPLTLEQITTSGTIVSQLVLSQTTTVANGVTEYAVSSEYGSSSEGTLELSSDGHSLVIAGYGVNDQTYNAGGAAVYGDARLAQSTSVPGGPFTPVMRVIADIKADGAVDSSTALLNVFNTNNPRSVATVNGSSFYITGQGVKGDTTQGVFYVVDGASSATSINAATDTRIAEIYNGRLYVSVDSTQGGGTTNISNYGSLPTSVTSPTVLTGLSQSVVLTSATANTVNTADIGSSVNLSPENFFFANANTLYVADGGVPKAGGLGDGGLQKWSLVNGTWTLDYTLSVGLNLIPNTNSSSSGDTGLIGLTGKVVGNSVELFATTEPLNDLGQTGVYEITDQLASTTGAGESFTEVLAASPGENIRGIAFAPTPNRQTAVDDFNGTGKSDILWSGANGDVTIWYANGSDSFTDTDFGVVPTSWQVAGTGDFNGNGDADILWRNSNGDINIWNSNGASGFTSTDLGTFDTSWQIAGTGDFSGNGLADILWHNSNGDTSIWNSNGSGGFTDVDLGVVNTSWQIAGTGDFTGNGTDDILWRNTANGDTDIWQPTGTGGITSVDLGIVPTSWQIAGVGDFTGNGSDDVLWRNTANGDTSIWALTGTGGVTDVDLGIVSTSWQIAGVGDFTGTGSSDILWRNANGDANIWNSNGTGGFTATDLGIVPTNWTVKAA